jgi:transcriptional regulator with XRE-family HTH domain
MANTESTVFDASLYAIAKRLKRFRDAQRMSQAEICRRTGIKPSAWSNYEQAFRRIPLDNAIELKRQFNLPIEWIYLGDTNGLTTTLSAALFPPTASPSRSRRSRGKSANR